MTWRGPTLACFLLTLALVVGGCGRSAPTTAPVPTRTVSPIPSPTPTVQPTPEPAPLYTPTSQPQIDTPRWFADAILYEIFVRSFYDQSGDGIGDLAGVMAKLDYVQELNVGAIWLMPIHPSPSYHGYDVTDYFAVNADYGTLDDMRALVDAAHQRGIKVIMDLVVNHTSNQHPFFVDAYGNPQSKYSDWYLWSNAEHTAYQAYGGYKAMPKLNHENPDVVAYVLDIARFWMDLDGDADYGDGVDGFRCDVAIEVPLSTWQALRKEMRRLNSESFLLGEVWDTSARDLPAWYEEAFDALFNFPLYADLAGNNNVSQDSLIAGAQRPDMVPLTLVAEDKLLPPGYEIVQFVNNHDTNRVMSDSGNDWARVRTAASLYLTLPGTPMIYYGEEIGMKGEKGQGHPYWDEYRREPMDWYAAETGTGMVTWFKPVNRYNQPGDGISVEEQAGVSGSLLDYYRALTTLRHSHPALQRGAFATVKVTGSQEVLAYTRHLPAAEGFREELFLVVLNFSDAPQEVLLELNPAYGGPFSAVDSLGGEPWPDVPAGQPYAAEVAAKSGTVLQLRRP